MSKDYRVVFTSAAENDFDSLYAYIAEHSGQARAEDFVGGIVVECPSLKTFPERGTKRDDVRPGLRTMGYARRVTSAFSVHHEAQTVAIHGIFYGGRNIETLLGED